MSITPHFFGSVVVFLVTICICVVLIRSKKLPKSVRWIQSREIWKCYDFIWYGSGLVALATIWMTLFEQEHRAEIEDLVKLMEQDASLVESAARSASIFCEASEYQADHNSRILEICAWIKGTYSLMQTQGVNAHYPASPLAVVVGHIEEWWAIPENPIEPSGFAHVTVDWDLLVHNLQQLIIELSVLEWRDDLKILLANPRDLPNGAVMDERLERIVSLRGEIIPKSSPLNIQGIWWLYLLAFLLGLKIAKTYAELILK